MTTGVRHDHCLTDTIGSVIAFANDTGARFNQSELGAPVAPGVWRAERASPVASPPPMEDAPTTPGTSEASLSKGGQADVASAGAYWGEWHVAL